MDFNIKLSNGQVLRGFIKSPGSDLKSVVILIHGLGEHIRRYDHWAEQFSMSNIAFAGVDLPGHGLSDGKRGHIRDYDLLDEMTDILLNESKKTFPDIPVFLYGQSLGGGIVLDYILRKEPEIKGAIVTSPWLKLSFEPPKSKVRLAGFIKNILPRFTFPNGLAPENLSHNKEAVERYKNDPLVHDKISTSLFFGVMTAATNTLKNASRLEIPVLLMHGSDDLICSPEGSREFKSKTEKAQLKIWDGGYHELHNEPFNKDVFEYIMGWMNATLV